MDEATQKYEIDLTPLYGELGSVREQLAKLDARLDLLAEADADIKRRVLTIEDFGAVPDHPDAATDNVKAINHAFNEAGKSHFAPIVIPGRAYFINDTIRIPKCTGIAVLGTGGGAQFYEVEYRRRTLGGPNSRLVWVGPDDRPMVHYFGSGLYWRGVQLHGRPKGSSDPKPAIGLLVNQNTGGLGSGKVMAPYIGVFECQTGIQFGEDYPGDNADVSQFGTLHGADCDTLFKVVSHQGLEYTIQFVRNQRCKTVFDFQGGGGLVVTNGQTLARGGTLLRLGANQEANCAFFRIYGWYVDSPAARTGFKLLEMEGRLWAHVRISATLPPHSYPTPIANVIGPTCLNLVETTQLREGTVEVQDHKGGPPTVLLDSCRMTPGSRPEKVVVVNGTGVRYNLKGTSCYNHRGELYDDFTIREPTE